MEPDVSYKMENLCALKRTEFKNLETEFKNLRFPLNT